MGAGWQFCWGSNRWTGGGGGGGGGLGSRLKLPPNFNYRLHYTQGLVYVVCTVVPL